MKPRTLLLPVFLAFACVGVATVPAPIQDQAPDYYGILTTHPQFILRRDWEMQPVGDVNQVERAYCVSRYEQVRVGQTTIYVVTAIGWAVVVHPTAWQIADIQCPPAADGTAAPTIHTHPASTCNTMQGTCTADSSRMTPSTCKPSDIDLHTLVKRRVPFSIVQCSPTVWTFFGPT